MKDGGKHRQSSRKDEETDRIRADLRAAGLLQLLETSHPRPTISDERNEAVVIPFRRPVVKPSQLSRWKHSLGAIAYLALAVGITLIWLR